MCIVRAELTLKYQLSTSDWGCGVASDVRMNGGGVGLVSLNLKRSASYLGYKYSPLSLESRGLDVARR